LQLRRLRFFLIVGILFDGGEWGWKPIFCSVKLYFQATKGEILQNYSIFTPEIQASTYFRLPSFMYTLNASNPRRQAFRKRKGDVEMKKLLMIAVIALFSAGYAYGEEITVPINLVTAEGIGKEIGTVTLSDGPYGLILTPRMTGLAPGIHGFHIHEKPDCGTAKDGDKVVPGLAAGGHFDPKGTGKHEGPYGSGHVGDLAALYVDKEGNATLPVLSPRLKVNDVRGRSLMIHAGGDNYSDQPEKLGGGGVRIACGTIK
jgi:Cu-Zn family superoxide dismutase